MELELGDVLVSRLKFQRRTSERRSLRQLLEEMIQDDPDCLSARDSDGCFPVHRAAESTDSNVLQLLLEVGAGHLRTESRSGDLPAHHACQKGGVQTVRLIYHTDPDSFFIPDHRGLLAVHCAAMNPSSEPLTFLIGEGINLRQTSNNGCTPAHYACHKGYLDTVQLLYRTDPGSFKVRNDRGFLPVHCAAENRRSGPLKFLISQGADLRAKTNSQRLPVHNACQEGCLNAIRFLYETDPQSFSETDDDGYYPLHCAAVSKSSAAATFLVRNGMNLRVRTKLGFLPAHLACRAGVLATVELFWIADPESFILSDSRSWRAVHFAATNNSTDILRFLIGQGLDLRVRAENGRLPVHLACQNGPIESLQLLLDTDPKCFAIADYCVLYPVHYAAAAKGKANLSFLLKKGASITQRTSGGCTVAHFACCEGDAETVKLLYETNPEIFRLRDNNGYLPIHRAAQNKSPDIIKYLIEAQEPLRERTKQSKLPAHVACKDGSQESVKLLYNADPHAFRQVDDNGWLPVHYAAATNKTCILNFLLEKGEDIKAKSHEGQLLLRLSMKM